MLERETCLAGLLDAHPVPELLLPFVLVWLLAVWAACLFRREPPIQIASRLSARASSTPQVWTYFAFLLWAGVSSLRSVQFWWKLGYSHGPDPQHFLIIAWSNLLAGGITCALISLTLTLRRIPASTLGLPGRQKAASILLLLTISLDSALWLGLMSFWMWRPAGRPLAL